jgi:hypothetical protein
MFSMVTVSCNSVSSGASCDSKPKYKQPLDVCTREFTPSVIPCGTFGFGSLSLDDDSDGDDAVGAMIEDTRHMAFGATLSISVI